jgi:hypothetical protein
MWWRSLAAIGVLTGSSRTSDGGSRFARTAAPTRCRSIKIRGAVLDVDRRQTDFAWLRSEVDRIRRLSERLNITAHHNGDRVELAASRYDARPLRDVLARVFADVSCHEVLVSQINQLIERCELSDAALAPMIAFEVLPKDRSYSGGSRSTTAMVREFASQITMNAGLVMNLLDRAGL